MRVWLAWAAIAGGGQAETPRLDCAGLDRLVAAARAPAPFAEFPRGPNGRWPLLGLGASCARGYSNETRLYCALHRRGGLTAPQIFDQVEACLTANPPAAPPPGGRPSFVRHDGLLRAGNVWLMVLSTSPHTRLGYQVVLWVGRGEPPRRPGAD